MVRARLLPIAVALVALAACAKVIGVDGLAIGECKGGVCEDDPLTPPDEEEASTPDVVAPPPFDGGPCSEHPGPPLVRVGTAENNFCIDSTEVTFGHYAAFLAAGVDAAAQPPECAWNATFAPNGSGGDDFPVTGVDWCDALAYCTWAGKYLCGRSEGSRKAGAVPQSEVSSYAVHQWMLACSNGGANDYPYGTTHDPSACNVGENDAGRALPVGSKPNCEGSYRGVFDMVGNVWEWYDGPCRGDAGGPDADASPANDECWLKGGSFINTGQNIDCRVDGLGSRRSDRTAFIGFRCCADD